MTGAELLRFITDNNLEQSQLTIEFFNFDRREKFCGGCVKIKKLVEFHRISTFEENSSSGYKHLCKVCFRKKYTHKKKVNNDFCTEGDSLGIRIPDC